MIFELLNLCIEEVASALHFKVGHPPTLRIEKISRPLYIVQKIRTDTD